MNNFFETFLKFRIRTPYLAFPSICVIHFQVLKLTASQEVLKVLSILASGGTGKINYMKSEEMQIILVMNLVNTTYLKLHRH